MNSRRNLLLVFAISLAIPLLAAGAPAAALQGGGGGRRGGPMSPDEQLKRMTKELNLTSDEQGKIKPILVDEQKKMEEVRSDSSLDRQTMREKMMQIRRDSNDQVRALLDDQQKEKFDKLERERQEMMRNRRGGPAGPGGDNKDGNAPPPQN
jgi:Spy/CpxP family protein refolding chaperone